ncbi:site-2 protease family protein [Rhodobacteraceae bacterium N5(2021)]|uniref:Zinc metalloprotease n=1 Tax=Gymnodinialimonas phycosphaerae TaxID=2841589 RepID=A0ABS7MVV1_9RHOB|nr:site-2 protease family protein [Gymnodinialimonas phycosphaerae]MBY4893873.1 site-2 protease family protein [Gymnodinialimonas phycosphaerae]
MWGRSIKVTELGGFDIKVDASWLLIAVLIVWSLSSGYLPDALPDASEPALLIAAIIATLGLFTSLVLHELAHSFMARHHGLQITGITLFLFGGVAEMKAEPSEPNVELQVAIVGPIASLVLAGLFWSSMVVARVVGLGPIVITVLGYLATINLILALFNMVPAFPLDGGRVFRAMLWRRSGDLVSATRRAAAASAVFAWGLIGLGALTMFNAGPAAGLWPILVGLFLLALGRASYQQVEMQQFFTGRHVADLMTQRAIVARPDQTLDEVVNDVFLAHGISFAPVTEDGVLLGYVDVHLVRRMDREHWATTIVDDVMESVSPDCAVSSDMPAQALLERMTQTGRRKFLVVDGKTLRGVVTLSDVTGFLSVSRQIASRV